MTDADKVLLFKLHPCSSGLDDDALEEIAEAAEIVHCEAGHVICQVDEPVTSVYLIVHGRLRTFRQQKTRKHKKMRGDKYGMVGDQSTTKKNANKRNH